MNTRRSWILLALFACFIIVVTILADKALLPSTLKAIPYYDSIGHFVLFGIYAFLAQAALGGKKVLHIPLGAGLIALYSTSDEFLQKLSPNRTFDLHDLFFSLLGVVVATVVYGYVQKKVYRKD